MPRVHGPRPVKDIQLSPDKASTFLWMLSIGLASVILTQRPGSFWLGILCGYLLAQVLHQRKLLRILLRPTPDRREAESVWPSETQAAPPEPDPIAADEVVAGSAGHAQPPTAPAWRMPAILQPLLQKALTWLRGGNPLARIGIVILFFGATFLARYSAERGLLPIELRLAALAAGALALLLAGWRLRQQRQVLAFTLQGGGLAGLYLTVFAAMRLYQLLPATLALGLLVVVAVSGGVLAVAQNARSLAIIATVGGFLAPILVSSGGGNHVALFSYYAVLNLGILSVAWFRAWWPLNLLGFVFTFGITGAFRGLSYTSADRLSTDLFLFLFFLMYVAVSILFSWRQKTDLKGYVSGSLVFGLPVVVFSLHATLVAELPYALAWSALGLGAFYLLLAYVLIRSRREHCALLAEAFAALGMIFASLAIPLAFDRQTTAAMWAIEGAGLLWLGLRQARALTRAFGALLQLAGGLGYLAGLARLSTDLVVFNSAWIGSTMLAIGGLCSGLWLHRHQEALKSYEKPVAGLAGLWGIAWWLGGGLAEIQRSLDAPADITAALLLGSLSTMTLFFAGRRLAWPLLSQTSALLWPAVSIGGLLASEQLGHPLAGWAVAAWVLQLGVLYLLLWHIDASSDEILRRARPWLHAGGAWLWVLLIAWEADWRLVHTLSGVWHELAFGLCCAALLWLLTRASPAWPVRRHLETYLGLAAAPVAVLAWVWILRMNLGQSGASGLPYLPLLNPLDVAVAVVFLAVANWWLTLGPQMRGRLWRWQAPSLQVLVGLWLFIWLNSALIRYLHHGFGTPLDFHGMRQSFMLQASLSVFWSLLGLAAMSFATRTGRRKLWLSGAGLMAVVVLKLFLIDLSGHGGLARIVSFLSVGALLLLAGYLSPLPPSRPAPQEHPE